MWLYPDNPDPRAVDEVRSRGGPRRGRRREGVPDRQGVNVTGEQQTKTRTALEYFARSMHKDLQSDKDEPERRARKPRTKRLQGGAAGQPAHPDAPDEQQPDVQQDRNP